MTRDHLLVIDQGTTSTRAVVYDDRLRPVGQSQLEVLPTYPRSGWVEHDPDALVELGRLAGRRGPARRGGGTRPDRGHRADQPARNHDRLGPRHGPADRPGPGLAGPPDGRGLRGAQDRTSPKSPSGPAW